jgi:DNA polymerase (family 10)
LGVKADITNFLQMAQDIHMNRMRFGVDQGRRGWLEAGDVINTRSLAQLRKLSKR